MTLAFISMLGMLGNNIFEDSLALLLDWGWKILNRFFIILKKELSVGTIEEAETTNQNFQEQREEESEGTTEEAETTNQNFQEQREEESEGITEEAETTNQNFQEQREGTIEEAETTSQNFQEQREVATEGTTEEAETTNQTFQGREEGAKKEMKKRKVEGCFEFAELEQNIRGLSICELRAYQRRIVASILEKNTVVLLPTGAGKTLIAAECAKIMGGKTLFLVPTCILVEQQADAIRKWTGLKVAEFMSGKSRAVLKAFDVLVATPEFFQRSQQLESSLSWDNFKLVCFDEAHHVLKHHPYRQLAMSLQESTAEPRILGLSASLTYEVKPEGIETQVQQLCNDLCIRAIATATDAELIDSGYHATQIPVEVRLPTLEKPMNYLPISERLPHDMRGQFFGRINSGKATAFASALVSVIRSLEAVCASKHSTFKSPLMDTSLTEWGAYALSLGVSTGCPFCKELSKWYESLRLLVVSFEDAEDTATMFLRMHGLDAGPGDVPWPPLAAEARENFLNIVTKTSFPRMENFKDCLRYKLDTTKDFRCIVFVDQRITTHILAYVISSDPDLSRLIRSTSIYAAGSSASASMRPLTKRDVADRVGAFASGQANMLLATVMAEEGMDIPEANIVVRFDSMVHSVSMVQGRGRARQEDSSLVVLSERTDRTVAKLREMEQLQRRIVSDFQADAPHHTLQVTPKDPNVAVAVLNHYCQKTKGVLNDYFTSLKSVKGWHDGWHCKLVYASEQRRITSESTGRSKKEAKASAAVQLMQALKVGDGEVR